MKLVTPESIRAAYSLLKRVAFGGIRMPSPRRFKFMAKRMRDFDGWYDDRPRIKKPEFVVDSGITDFQKFLCVVAHEMCHVALDTNGKCDHSEHDENFKALARIIEHEMGWPKGAV